MRRSEYMQADGASRVGVRDEAKEGNGMKKSWMRGKVR
jgi:hypothetical protein